MQCDLCLTPPRSGPTYTPSPARGAALCRIPLRNGPDYTASPIQGGTRRALDTHVRLGQLGLPTTLIPFAASLDSQKEATGSTNYTDMVQCSACKLW